MTKKIIHTRQIFLELLIFDLIDFDIDRDSVSVDRDRYRHHYYIVHGDCYKTITSSENHISSISSRHYEYENRARYYYEDVFR